MVLERDITVADRLTSCPELASRRFVIGSVIEPWGKETHEETLTEAFSS
jgi:hypothetical protein